MAKHSWLLDYSFAIFIICPLFNDLIFLLLKKDRHSVTCVMCPRRWCLCLPICNHMHEMNILQLEVITVHKLVASLVAMRTRR
jgi:hypothetical protein